MYINKILVIFLGDRNTNSYAITINKQFNYLNMLIIYSQVKNYDVIMKNIKIVGMLLMLGGT
jgi:hypothetical protein